MNPFWIDYSLWEDYNNGMYENVLRTGVIIKCEELFRSENLYTEMSATIKQWQNAAKVNLSHNTYNKRAWVGQATCCRVHGASINETVTAWTRISQKQRDEANRIADNVIYEFERGKPKLKYIQTKMF